MTESARLGGLIRTCLDAPNPLDAFNHIILRRGPYWRAQRRICRALWDPAVKTVVVPAGHSVGKSYVAAGILLGWLVMQRNSMVVSTSPSNTQLSLVLWKEIRRARSGSPIMRRLGRVTQLPNKFDLGNGWMGLGYATNKAERLQGNHAAGGLMLNIVDEASGIDDADIWATLKSLKPDKTLLISNPLHPHGYFYDQCRRSEDDPAVRMIRIPSTDSPDIDKEKSEIGLADAGWLREMIADYGEDSQMFRVRVKAQFPDDVADALVPAAWLDRCTGPHVPGGKRRISVDLGLGSSGDQTVILVRDDNGIIHFEADNRWPLDVAAKKVALAAERFGVDPHRISYDFTGIGASFGAELRIFGLVGCMGYRGGLKSKNPSYHDLRTAAHWLMRTRLNPNHVEPGLRRLPPFYIPAEYLGRLRKELRQITLELDNQKRNKVRDGTEVRESLRYSPDYCDALAQSFAFPG